ncbi:MAG: NADH-quinone oxidoreductase subunit M [Phycisphaerales bacterium]|nr:NADH-quinone oxidoreductase subunit M [Phycisphaerales bacterium]
MLIPILILLPILGAMVTLLAPRRAGVMALVASLVPLAVVIYMVAVFPDLHGQDAHATHFNFAYDWLPSLGVRFLVGVDAISLWLIVLTAILTPISILASFQYIKERQREFYAWMLMLHAGMLGVFAAKDILVFYLFFEFTLIPMFFIIGIWGGEKRRQAAGKFFLFTFAGSVLTLASLLYICYLNSLSTGVMSFALTDLYAAAGNIDVRLQYLLFAGLMAGFAVKVPLFPVHTWLPLAHTEAPTAGSVILAGVLLKLGTYGMLRYMIPILPDATRFFAPAIAAVCIIGIIYGALVSWVQGDMKRLIAYSSVSHLGFCVLGMFALTPEGLTGSVLYMLNHGLSTGALFLVVGMIYERYHTRDMNLIGGIAKRAPALAFFAVFFVLSSVGLPGLNGFVSEFLVLIGTFTSGKTYGNLGPAFAIPAALGVILAAVYLLYWTGRIVFGPLNEPQPHHDEDDEYTNPVPVHDLSLREWTVLVPLAVLVLFMGVYPKPVISSLAPPVQSIADSLCIQPLKTYEPRKFKATTIKNTKTTENTKRIPASVDLRSTAKH